MVMICDSAFRFRMCILCGKAVSLVSCIKVKYQGKIFSTNGRYGGTSVLQPHFMCNMLRVCKDLRERFIAYFKHQSRGIILVVLK